VAVRRAGFEVVVVGASAGGVEALLRFVGEFPEDFPAAIFVVLHIPATGTSVLPGILTRAGRLAAAHAEDETAIEPGRIYVAPPDYHLSIERSKALVGHGPRENGHRPAIDPLFRSAAQAYGRAVAGVILSGTLDDGSAGLAAIKKAGGLTLVQDPQDALYSAMPLNALKVTIPDYVLPAEEIAATLTRLARRRAANDFGRRTGDAREPR
jgi:two-component system chemotaxis response regulator CheB